MSHRASHPSHPSLTGRRLPQSAAARLLVVLAGAGLITLSAKVQIPFWPVPMTLQTLAIMAIAVTLPPRLAIGAMLAYLAAGAFGLPVFAGSPERGLGLAYMAGPTGGYLAGYLAAMALTSVLAHGRGPLAKAGAMLLGLALIYAAGLAWLALYLPARTLLAQGFTPFILGDLVKIALIAAAVPLVTRLTGKGL